MKHKQSLLLRALLILTPALVFVIGEMITGNLFSITPLSMALNLAVYELLFLGALIFFRGNRISWPVLTTALTILAAAEYFVIGFRERPIMIWDVLALRTAMSVSSNYEFRLTAPLIFCILAAGVLAAAVYRNPVRLWAERRAGWRRQYLAAVTAWLFMTAAFGGLLFGVLSPVFGLDVHMWDPIAGFEKNGYLLSTVLSFKSIAAPRPLEYSDAEAEDILAAFKAGEEDESTTFYGKMSGERPVNVICIMNESFSDLTVYEELREDTSFEISEDVLTQFKARNRRTKKGLLAVPVFGAMTANSEYEFLTGNTCALTPQGSVPYQFYTKPGEESLARTFKEAGYHAVAMHPYPGYNWNRTEAYENLGFDEFLDQEYFDGLEGIIPMEKPRGYLSDRSNYDVILHFLKEKTPGEPLFLFDVTMQNHGGFEVEGFPSTVHVTRVNGRPCEGEYPKADQYLTLMQMSDQALSEFLDALESCPEPTMVVLFGDHQPSVEVEFFEALYKSRWSEVPEADKLTSFLTPWMIWTNYDGDSKEETPKQMLSAFMLGNEVLKAAGLPLTGFRTAIEEVRAEYPVIHAMGVVDQNGEFTDVMTLGGLKSLPEFRTVHVLQYYRMFGHPDRHS